MHGQVAKNEGTPECLLDVYELPHVIHVQSGAVLISGVFDLRPLLETSENEVLNMSR